MLKVVILGYGELAQGIILGILKSRHRLVGAMRWHRNFLTDIFMPDALLSLINANNIREISAPKANSKKFIREIKKLKPDVIIVGSWGEIIKEEVIKLPRVAFINCHPSLLPRYRGANPYSSVIKNGEVETGVTFHLMDKKIDAGDILMQEKIFVESNETAGSLRIKCALKAKEMVGMLLDRLERGEIIPEKQNHEEASYFPPLSEEDVMINWQMPAHLIDRQIRAILPNMQCYTQHKNNILTTNSSKIIDLKKPVTTPGIVLKKQNNKILVSTGDQNKAILLDNVGVYGSLFRPLDSYYVNTHLKAGDLLS